MTTHILITGSSSLTVVGGQTLKPRNRANLFAVAGGLMQMALSLGILFLPVLQTCRPQGGEMVCHGRSYIQQGGNLVGFSFLVLLIVLGALAVFSTQMQSPIVVKSIRWLAVLVSVIFAVLAAWSIGLIFVPGALLLLLSALFSRQGVSQ